MSLQAGEGTLRRMMLGEIVMATGYFQGVHKLRDIPRFSYKSSDVHYEKRDVAGCGASIDGLSRA